MSKKKYHLYSSEGCHLCEQALALCLSVLSAEQLNEIDIVEQVSVSHESQTLVELYGVHIPVLESLHENSTNNQKLYWPFSAEQIGELR